MPLEASFEWRQTGSLLVIEIPLKGSSASAVNINATEFLLKVNFDRYLLHLDLLHPIVDTKCVAKIKNGILTLKIPKKDNQVWETLQVEGLSKDELKVRRTAAIEAKAANDSAILEKAKDRKIEDERKALRKQMALEEDERQHIEDLKSEEKRKAEENIFRAIAKDSSQQKEITPPEPPRPISQNSQSNPPVERSDDDLNELDDDEINAMLEDSDEEKEEEYEMVEAPQDNGPDIEEAYTPSPRVGGVVKFNFTPRIFPTPMRESKQCEEEDWIAKNRNHLRHNPQLKPQLDALDIGDSDPVWLKGKGDDFYRARDYRAALNAYTTALEIAPNMLNVLANRGACHLQLGELVRCVEDCDALITSLDLESMGVDANPADVTKLGMRIKALTRRGAAKCAQGRFDEALQDLKEASYLSPSDSSLDTDLTRVSNLAKCDKLKKEADCYLGGGELERALETYTTVLNLDAKFVSALSNRAACYLALGRYIECATDCSNALDLLETDPQTDGTLGITSFGNSTSPGAPSGPVPPSGSTKRRTWVLKTVARRGVARAQLGQIEDAVVDYKLACKLDPDNQDLKKDLEALEKQMGSSAEMGDGAT